MKLSSFIEFCTKNPHSGFELLVMLASSKAALGLSLENRAKLLSTLPVIDNSYVNGEYCINIVVS